MAWFELSCRSLVSSGRYTVLGCLLLVILLSRVGLAQSTESQELTDEERKQQQIADRFQSILEKSPRRGTALDRVYGQHIESGTLDRYLGELKERADATPGDGTAAFLLGLLEAQRGRDFEAVKALSLAESLRPTDPLVPYYLAQSLVLAGEPTKAVQAFERSLALKPERSDLIEIFQQLGRLHQRAQRREAAVEVWKRMEAMFPDDPRVLEQIAVILVEEDELAQALPRYVQLIQLVKDDYRRSMFRIQAADLKVRMGNAKEGLRDFEALLSDLNPDGWMAIDVRRRIENVFLRALDLDGLVRYYEEWLKTHPDDLDAMARLAKYLAGAARVPEATEWLERALKKAPTRVQLRRAFIEQLVDRQDYSAANEQYKLLVQASPGNSDFLRDWGRLVLKDKTVSPEQRKAEAARIWKLILLTQPGDAINVVQVADLFRHAQMNDEALALYQQAVELKPAEPQYREYLGEFYQILNRPEEALKTWKEMVTGDRRNAENCVRQAEILQRFGYQEQALESIRLAIELDSKDLFLQMKAADALMKARKYDEALGFVKAAEAITADDDEREAVLKLKIECLQASQQLEAEIEKLDASLQAGANGTSRQWVTLARYLESARKWDRAQTAIDEALKLEPASIPLLVASARILGSSGKLGEARDLFLKLADLDRRSRGDHLTSVVRLSTLLGQKDAALAAGRELILSAPGKTESYETYSQLCFQLGEAQEGLNSLRKALRINPTDSQLMTTLASALASQFKTTEAIELYWRAFDKQDQLEDQIHLVTKLAELHLQTSQLDRLTTRLERSRKGEDKRRSMTICLAQVYVTAREYSLARTELESLLTSETRDSELLQQLSKLCEQERDFGAAIKYQRQIVSFAPSAETELRLADLYSQAGQAEQAREIVVRFARQEEDPIRLLKNIDTLLARRDFEAALVVIGMRLREEPENWELLYREGVALAALDRIPEATERFDRILTLKLPLDTQGVRIAEQFRQAFQSSRGAYGANPAAFARAMRGHAASRIIQNTQQIKDEVGLPSAQSFNSIPPQSWRPESYEVARHTCLAWKLKFARSMSASAELLKEIRAEAEKPDADRTAMWDWFFVLSLEDRWDELLPLLRRSIKQDSVEDWRLYFQSVAGLANVRRSQSVRQGVNVKPIPKSEDELGFLLEGYRLLLEGMAKGDPQNQLQGQDRLMDLQLLMSVVRELKIAERTAEAKERFLQVVDRARSQAELSLVMSLSMQDGLDDNLPVAIERWQSAVRERVRRSEPAVPGPSLDSWTVGIQPIQFRMNQLLIEMKPKEALALFDFMTDLAFEDQQRLIASQATGGRPSTQFPLAARTHYTIYGLSGTASPSVRVDEISFSGQDVGRLLHQAIASFTAQNSLNELEEHLRARVANAPPVAKTFHTGSLADFLLSTGRLPEALEVLDEGIDLRRNDPQFAFAVASLYENTSRFADALKLLDGVEFRDSALQQRRELLAIDLAERVGDVERMRLAAERLFGMRLAPQEQLALIPKLHRAGQGEMAEAMIARVQKQSGNQMPVLLNLMEQAMAQGKTDLAKEMASSILQKQPPATHPDSRGIRIMSKSAQSQERQLALKVLANTGGLKERIQTLELRKEKSQLPIPLLMELIELYEAEKKTSEVRSLMSELLRTNPDNSFVRLQYAQILRDSGNAKEACDHVLILLKEKPEWFLQDLHQVVNLFQEADRVAELGAILAQVDTRNIRSSWAVVNLAQNLLANERTHSVGEVLAVKLSKDHPEEFRQLISGLHNVNSWRSRTVIDLGLKVILPTTDAPLPSQWVGLETVNSFRGGGRAEGAFSRLMGGAVSAGFQKDLREAIAVRQKALPDWRAGAAMLAIIDIKEGKKEVGIRSLEKLFPDEASFKNVPAAACWLIGQELAEDQSTYPLALKLMKLADSENVGVQFQFSPVEVTVTLLGKMGRKEEAKSELLAAFKKVPSDNYDANYKSYQLIENSRHVARRLWEIGYPEESLKIYRGALARKSVFEEAAAYHGQPEVAATYRSEFEKGIASCQQAILNFPVERALASIAPADGGTSSSVNSIDFMLVVPDVNSLGEKPISSELLPLLKKWKEDPATHSVIADRIAALRQQRPEDPSVQIFAALWGLQLGGQLADSEIATLLKFIADHPLKEMSETSRSTFQTREQAQRLLPVWLVASGCLIEPARLETGIKLSELALQAGKLQEDPSFSLSVRYELGLKCLELGRKDQAERNWYESLALASRRPEGALTVKATPGSPQTSALSGTPRATAAPSTVPPLTLAQFRACLRIALSAAENGMETLSLQSVKVAMQGGMPIDDASSRPTSNQNQPTLIVRPAGSVGLNLPKEGVTSEVSRSLREVLSLWEARKYSAAVVYEMLKAAVLPESRADEVLLFPAVNQDSLQARDDDLANQLVIWTRQAGKLDDIKAEVTKRSQTSRGRVAGLSLLLRLNLAECDLDSARTRLRDLTLALSKQSYDVESAASAAAAAIEVPELLTDAGLLLLRVMESRLDRLESEAPTASAFLSNSWTVGLLQDLVNDGQLTQVSAFIERYAMIRQKSYDQYAGTYRLHIQNSDFANIANTAALVGDTELALKYFGRVLDTPPTNMGEVKASFALTGLARGLSNRTAAERAEIWQKWTFPENGSQQVRAAYAMAHPFEIASSEKLNPSVYPIESLKSLQRSSVLSNFEMLVDAAEEAGVLADLKTRTSQTRESAGEQVEPLWLLVLMRSGDLETVRPLIENYFATTQQRHEKRSGSLKSNFDAEATVWQELVRTPGFSELMKGISPEVLAIPGVPRPAALIKRMQLDQSQTAVQLTDRQKDLTDVDFEFWTRGSARPSDAWSRHSPRLWFAEPDRIVQASSSSSGTLDFRYPLSGEWQFDVDIWATPDAGVGVGMSGELISLFRSQQTGNGFAGGLGVQASALRRGLDHLNHVRIESAQGVLRYLVNGQCIRESSVSESSPWLQIALDAGSFSAVSDARLSGSPQIPTEVNMIPGTGLSGWTVLAPTPAAKGETEPGAMAGRSSVSSPTAPAGNADAARNKEWSVTDGVLSVVKSSTGGESDRGVRYSRPLQSGDRIDYEFWYEPGMVEVSPVYARWIFDVSTEKVRPRWQPTSTLEEQVQGIPTGNRTKDLGRQLSDQNLPLNAEAWNQASLEVRDDVVILTINEVPVYEFPRDSNRQETFGFCCVSSMGGRVRNARLTGAWSTATEAFVDVPLLGPAKGSGAGESIPGSVSMPVGYHRARLFEFVRSLEKLSAEEASQRLTGWVFPTGEADEVQWTTRLSPRGTKSDSMGSFEELIAPVWILVQHADKAGQLAELKQRTEALPPDATPIGSRSSLLALIALQQKELKEVMDYLNSAREDLNRESETGKQQALHEASLVVCWMAAAQPELLDAAHRLAEAKQTLNLTDPYRQSLHIALLQRTSRLKRLAEAAEQPFSQWKKVSLSTAVDRWAGSVDVDWRREGTRLITLPGSQQSDLYFESPLTGDFEVQAALASASAQQIFPFIGLSGVMSDVETKKLTLVDFNRFDRVIPWNPKSIPASEGAVRIAVKNNVATTYYNDVQISEEKFSTPPPPWLVLRSRNSGRPSELRQLAITGTPAIPDEVPLMTAARMKGWSAADFGHPFVVDAVARPQGIRQLWAARNGELAGDVINDGRKDHETLVQYCRPCFEDSEVTFEMFYKPQELEVAPVVGRTAFLLNPQGVQTHHVTGAQYDVDGFSSTNRDSIAGASSSVPLKADDWNQVKLTIQRDRVTVHVNDEEVASTTLVEQPGERFFGFFRYADQTGCRVRNAVLRGNWPKALPSLDQQELGGVKESPSVSAIKVQPPESARNAKTVLVP